MPSTAVAQLALGFSVFSTSERTRSGRARFRKRLWLRLLLVVRPLRPHLVHQLLPLLGR